ncbi:LPS-assembly protein LptD [Phenylobacterium sp.]|uniref:LPS-assembly protein LptD n=1 Tax=Phenylobacterium sp. TaxID=1871053 RepID=UPI002E31B9DD|nr:LPS-assembly protein LptD [Phenylobacterium sp.]HEX3366959.1 LPS-assembly protein LptD [Phenylobacterium sp.]
MSPRRRALLAERPTPAPWATKRALLAGATAAMLWPTLAFAQQQAPPTYEQGPLGKEQRGQILNDSSRASQTPKAAPAPNLDGLKPGELYIEADQLSRDDKNGITTAEGNVEVRYQDRTLRADKLVYKEPPPPPEGQARPPHDKDAPAQGVIRAYGHVQIIHDDGEVEYANQITLDDKMQAAVAIGFSESMHDKRANQDVKISGDTAVRRSEDLQELNKAIYTPCPICTGNTPKKPTWSVSADRIVQDQVHHIIYYRHARIHVLGVPIIYLPVFWHADPTAERESGLLAPRIGVNSRRGFSYDQPYLWVISPSADLTIAPQINSNVNPFLNLHYRQLFADGELDLRAGYTYERDLEGAGTRFGDLTNRSYILGRGVFHPDEDWTLGFTAERASDPLIFDKYDIGKVYQARGPYVPDDRRLISQAYAIRQDDNSYASVAAFSIQGLRPGDNNRTFPLVAPVIDTHLDDPDDVLGGRLRFTASAVSLTRDQSPDNQQLNQPGLDSARISGGLDWRRIFTSEAGLRVEPFVQMRLDGYNVRDILVDATSNKTTSLNEARAVGVAGADISYPLYRRWGDATVILEPLAQIALSPKAQQVTIGHDATGKPIYLDEDSVAFEFDETTLFQANKFPGNDLYEDGLRLNVAGRGSILWDDGRRASLLIGRSFRDSPNTVFAPGSGLTGTSSDWIIAGDAAPMKGLSFFGRARLDANTFEVHRLEAGANFNGKWGSGYVRYLKDDQGINGTPIKNTDMGADINLTKHWGLSAYGNRDLIQNAWVIRDTGVFYKDECIRVDVFYRHEDVIIGRLTSSDQLSIRLTLATLGAPFYGR